MKYTVIIYLLFIFTCNSQNKDWELIINLSSQKLSASKSLSYEADYKIKSFDDTDTIRFPKLNYFLLKKPSDSILNFLVKVKLVDFKQDKIYDGKSFYTVLHQDKVIEAYSVEDFGKSFVKNNIYRQALPNFLISDNGFESFIKNHNGVVLKEIVEENRAAWRIEFDFPTNEEITLLKRIVYIDKQSQLPYRYEGFAKYMGLQDEYFSLEINNLEINQDITEDFFQFNDRLNTYSKKNIKRDLIHKDKVSPKTATDFIDFEGINTKGIKIKIDNAFYDGKLVLIDFWHLRCAPCLKAMPKLNELYKKYSGKDFIILGVNPLDDINEKSKLINEFLFKLKVDYNTVFTNKELMKSYQVNSFPTVLLFKDGKLIYSKIGYQQNGLAELETMIKNNL